MREPKNQMLGTMEPPLMQLSVKVWCFWSQILEKDFQLFSNISSQIFVDFDQKQLVYIVLANYETENLPKWKIWVGRARKTGFSFFRGLIMERGTLHSIIYIDGKKNYFTIQLHTWGSYFTKCQPSTSTTGSKVIW